VDVFDELLALPVRGGRDDRDSILQ
jgi:hypothetical protein